MARERPILILDELAGEDFSSAGSLSGYQSTGQFLIVKQRDDRTAFTVTHCSNHHDRPLGVIQNNPKSGDAAAVMVAGETKIVAGGAINPGDSVGTDGSGRAVRKNETSTGADYGDFVIGVARDAVTAAGQLVTVLLTGTYRI